MVIGHRQFDGAVAEDDRAGDIVDADAARAGAACSSESWSDVLYAVVQGTALTNCRVRIGHGCDTNQAGNHQNRSTDHVTSPSRVVGLSL